MSEALDTLREGWMKTTAALGADSFAAESVFADLDARYSEPRRAYHTWSHIAHVYEVSRWLLDRVVAPEPPITLAVFFHDAVYRPERVDPGAAGTTTGGAGEVDDEEASGRLALTACSLMDLPDDLAREVYGLVLATRDHRSRAPAQAVMCDADLAILAADPKTYDVYRRSVRVEYAHLDDDTFRRGRAGLLRGLAARPQLYATTVMRDRGERVARANIERELDELA